MFLGCSLLVPSLLPFSSSPPGSRLQSPTLRADAATSLQRGLQYTDSNTVTNVTGNFTLLPAQRVLERGSPLAGVPHSMTFGGTRRWRPRLAPAPLSLWGLASPRMRRTRFPKTASRQAGAAGSCFADRLYCSDSLADGLDAERAMPVSFSSAAFSSLSVSFKRSNALSWPISSAHVQRQP
jgi:hypothetical protein